MTPRVLLLVDGHSLAYRAFHALPVEGFSTRAGQPTNAVFGFVSMFLNAVRDEQPDLLAVAFDVGRRTFRTDAYPEYKATRAASPPEFAGQVALIEQVLDSLGVVRIGVAGYEADDVIATLATAGEGAGVRVLILTGDRDAFQLVDDLTTVLYARRGVSDCVRMTPQEVLERYGVPPERYADLAALRGDTSDNLPSVPGVGDKTAARWLAEYGSLTALLDNADRLGGKAGQSLRDHVEQVRRNRELTALVRDVPVPVELADLTRAPVPAGPLAALFDALEFRVLRERVAREHAAWVVGLSDRPGEAAPSDVGEGAPPPADVLIGQWQVDDPGAAVEWLDRHAGAPVGLALRWAGEGEPNGGANESGPPAGSVTVAIAAAGPTDADEAICVTMPLSAAGEGGAADLRTWLADPRAPKAVHDAKAPMRRLGLAGVPMAGVVADPAVAAYLLLPGQPQYPLPELARRFLSVELAPAEAQPAADEGLVAAAAATRRLAAVLATEIDQRGGTDLMTGVEIPLIDVLVAMELAGIAVDDDQLDALETEFGHRGEDLSGVAAAQAGHPFNLGSPKQVQQVLFAERGLPRTKRTKTGYTTDAEALTDLYARTADPLLATILQWRDVARLRQTVAGLRPLIEADGRIRTTFNQMVSATGRLSTMDPNLQSIPVRTADGRRIREAFIAGAGYASLLTADYSQIELRIMAHLSNDPALIDALCSGEDLHVTMASLVFGVPPAQVDGALRSRVKAVSYGLAYGLSPFGLSGQLGISVPEARDLTDAYFSRFGAVREYLQGAVEQARRDGYTETLLGRRRYLPDLVSGNRQRRDAAERMALNAPIQGSAADIVKKAMIDVHRGLAEHRCQSRLVLQVHDELVLEVAPGEAEVVSTLIRARMASAAQLRVPLEVSIGIGPSWDAAAH